MRRLAGYDLNGWRDLSVRNWLQQPGEEDLVGPETMISGGIAGSVVALGKEGHRLYVGGSQARLAPHGMGTGWGAIGEPARRSRVCDLLQKPEIAEDQLAAAISGLARSPDIGVLAIADTGAVNEFAQETLLEALRRSGVRRRLLVWRPILAVLPAIDEGTFSDRALIGVVSHTHEGLATQILTVRQGTAPAPERRKAGTLYCSELGLFGLRELAARMMIPSDRPRSKVEHLYLATAADRLALGEAVEIEAVRQFNGTWDLINPPLGLALPVSELPQNFAADFVDCDVVMLETPSIGAVAKDLIKVIENNLEREVVLLPPDTVARGAFIAAGRLNGGKPIYYDFLPQISTIVEGENGAQNYDLIPEGDLLPAGQIYRSATPARFLLQPNQNVIEIYLKKQTTDAPRSVEVMLGESVARAVPVDLSVEQVPAAGRARLTLTSEAFSAPHIIDWDGATILEKSWTDLIENRPRLRPVIPDRMVLPNGIDVWRGIANRAGLSDVLKENIDGIDVNWGALASLAASRPEGCYALNSDGAAPRDLPQQDLNNLDTMLQYAEREVQTRIATGRNPDNEPLKFATWTFRRCPASLAAPMIEALDAEVINHSLLLSGGSRTLIYQGLGRILCQEEEIRQVLDHLLAIPRANWKKNQIACMAFLVSRTDETPRMLTRENVETLARIVADSLRGALSSQYTSSFIYSPLLLVGLLRWRLVDPWALVLGHDTAADLMVSALDDVIKDLAHKMLRDARLSKHHRLLKQSREALEGIGTHSNLLVQIYGLG